MRSANGAASAVVAASLLAAHGVAAAGDTPPLGNDAALAGGAMVAAGRGGSMAWYNPAGLGANRRRRLEATAQLFTLRLRGVDDGLVTSLAAGSLRSPIRGRELQVVPNSTSFVLHVAPAVSVALALFVPDNDEINVDEFKEGRRGAIQYAQQVKVSFTRRRYDFGPSVGWEIAPEVRIGCGAYLVYEKVAYSSRVWALGHDQIRGHEKFVQNEASQDVRSWGGELVAGVQWQPTRYLHLGLAIRSPRFWFSRRSVRSSVEASGGRDPEAGSYGELTYVPRFATGLVRTNEPVRGTAGIAYEWPRGTLSVEADVSAARRRSTDADELRAAWAMRAGVRARVTRQIWLGGGLFTARSALVSADEFLDFDLDSYGGSLSGALVRPVRLGRRERAHRIVFNTTVAVRYAFSVGRAGSLGIDLSQLANRELDVTVTSGLPVRARVHDLALHVGSGISF